MFTPDLDHLIQTRLGVDRRQIETLCQRWQVSEMGLFGSILREDFGPESDVDVLVNFVESQEKCWNLLDLIHMQQELQGLFQRPVDLVEKAGLRNPYRRADILNSQRVIYVRQ